MPTPTNKQSSTDWGEGRPRPVLLDGAQPSPKVKGIFAPQYFGSVYYYAALAACDEAIIDIGMRYDKRFKSIHRCTVADTRGPLTLTVPVSKSQTQRRPPKGMTATEGMTAPIDPYPEGATVLGASAPRGSKWRQWTVSSHGEWWADHRVSLESGYGRTPYFEFYIDRFLPWLSDRNDTVVDFDCTLDRVIRRTLGITTDVKYIDLSDRSSKIFENSRELSKTLDGLAPALSEVAPALSDLAPGVAGLAPDGYSDHRNNRFEGIVDVPYWQVRADRLGFLPGLSILDLMFNIGPEAALVLHRMVQQ